MRRLIHRSSVDALVASAALLLGMAGPDLREHAVMSGQMSPKLASAAGAIALQAEAAARGMKPGHLIAERARAVVAKRAKEREESLASQTWRAMSLRVRMVIVMLEGSQDGDPRVEAAKPWGSFTDSQRAAMGAAARAFSRDTAKAAYLV